MESKESKISKDGEIVDDSTHRNNLGWLKWMEGCLGHIMPLTGTYLLCLNMYQALINRK